MKFKSFQPPFAEPRCSNPVDKENNCNSNSLLTKRERKKGKRKKKKCNNHWCRRCRTPTYTFATTAAKETYSLVDYCTPRWWTMTRSSATTAACFSAACQTGSSTAPSLISTPTLSCPLFPFAACAGAVVWTKQLLRTLTKNHSSVLQHLVGAVLLRHIATRTVATAVVTPLSCRAAAVGVQLDWAIIWELLVAVSAQSTSLLASRRGRGNGWRPSLARRSPSTAAMVVMVKKRSNAKQSWSRWWATSSHRASTNSSHRFSSSKECHSSNCNNGMVVITWELFYTYSGKININNQCKKILKKFTRYGYKYNYFFPLAVRPEIW